MLKNLAEKFEEEKSKRCVICGGIATHKCSETVGTLSCDASLCNSDVCNYVHNLVKHPNKIALLKRYESRIPSDIIKKALYNQIRTLNNSLKEYEDMLSKTPNVTEVTNMFNNLILSKEEEIKRVTSKLKEIQKENKVANHL